MGKLTFKQCEDIYGQLELGYTQKELAIIYGVSQASISYAKRKVERELAREEERMAQKEVVVAGDKENGRLVLTSTDGKQYDGYRRKPNGKMEKKRFTGRKEEAIADWERWKDEKEPDWVTGERAVEVCEEKPAEKPVEEPEEFVASEKVWLVTFTGVGGKTWLFYDADKALMVADSLNSAIESLDIGEYTVEEGTFWEL